MASTRCTSRRYISILEKPKPEFAEKNSKLADNTASQKTCVDSLSKTGSKKSCSVPTPAKQRHVEKCTTVGSIDQGQPHAPDNESEDINTRRSKRRLNVPAKYTHDLGSFDKKQVKKKPDLSQTLGIKCKKIGNVSPKKDFVNLAENSKSKSGKSASPIILDSMNKSDIEKESDNESETVKHFADGDSSALLDNLEKELEGREKTDNVKLQSEKLKDVQDSDEKDGSRNSVQNEVSEHHPTAPTPLLPDFSLKRNEANLTSISDSSLQANRGSGFMSELTQVDEMENDDVMREFLVNGGLDISRLGFDILSPAKYSSADVTAEKTQDKVFGSVSAIVKPMTLDKEDFRLLLMGVAKRTGITPMFSTVTDTLIHGSWQAVNRAYQLLQDVEKLLFQKGSLSSSKETQCNEVDVTNCDSDTEERSEEDVQVKEEISVDNSGDAVTTECSVLLYCVSCNRQFRNSHQLKLHVRTHENEPNEWKCPMCEKKFNAKRYLQVHLKRHSRERKYKCPICGWAFFERNKLKLHMERHKSANKRNLPYECSKCQTKFYNKAALTDHMNTHSGERPYKCQICQSSFSHRVGLRRHILIHSNDKLFKCNECEKAFRFRDKLNAHMVQHTGVGGHTCSSCHKVFTALSSLRRHRCTAVKPLVIDTDETIFMCGVCGEVSESLEDAQTHIGVHDNPGIISIEDCDFIKVENEEGHINNSSMLEIMQNIQVGSVVQLDSLAASKAELECTTAANSEDAIAEKHLVANTLADLSVLA
ncbi:hypothetical protein ScPMuIL_008331 [Solemya velum]